MNVRYIRAFFFLLFTISTQAGCNGVFFYPSDKLFIEPKDLQLQHEDIFFKNRAGQTLHAWFLPSKGTPTGTLLFLHGNAENISSHIMSVHWLPAEGYNVFLLDYRGYGISEGTPGIQESIDDATDAFFELLKHPGVDTSKIVLFGQSLGGAIAIDVAARAEVRNHIQALAVDSAFSSFRQIARDKLSIFWLSYPFQYPLSWLITSEYEPIDAIKKLSKLPILLIHGQADPIVPAYHSDRLYEAAEEPKQIWRIPGVGHIGSLRILENRLRFLHYLEEVLRDATSP